VPTGAGRALGRARPAVFFSVKTAGVRRRARPRNYAPASSYAAHVPYTFCSRLRAASGGAAHELLRLSLKERVRAALALNILTHALFTLLLWAVVWAARSG